MRVEHCYGAIHLPPTHALIHEYLTCLSGGRAAGATLLPSGCAAILSRTPICGVYKVNLSRPKKDVSNK